MTHEIVISWVILSINVVFSHTGFRLHTSIVFKNLRHQKPRERLNDRLRQLNFPLPLQRLFIGRVHIFLIFNFQGTNSFLSFRPAAFTADGCYARKVVTAYLASVTVRKGMWSIQMELKDDRHQFAFQPLV